jgi:hypothetical protein
MVTMKDGTQERAYRSISFKKMDQTEFAAFYDKTLDMLLKHWIPTVTKTEVERELMEFAA